MSSYRVEVEWQIFRLSEHRHLDEFLEEIIDKLKQLCRVDEFKIYGELLSFDIIFEAESTDHAEELAKAYTKDSFMAVLNGSQMILVDMIVKELSSAERANEVQL